MIPNKGSISAHLATDRALELFARVDKADYVGWQGSQVGPKGRDESLLAGFTIIDDPKNDEDAESEDEVCLHETVEPFEDQPTRGACTDCGEEFELAGDADRAA